MVVEARKFSGLAVDTLDDRFHETDHGTGNLLADSSFVVDRTRSGIMAGWRQAVALAMTGEEIEALTALSRSRTEPAGRVSRAAMLLGYREKPSFFAVGRRLGVHHQTVQRCVERAMAYGALAALDDRPRPGKEPTITPEAKAWLVSLACDKAKEHGYPHELWTTRLLARHARERGPAAGHQCLARLAQGTVCKLLGQEEIKPHKVRYYLERRDAEFEPKMAEVLCVYREVQVLKKAAAKAEKSNKPVAIVSYDEKPGIQAIATTAPDLPPVPGRHASFARDHEYKRHGTLSLLAGIDLLTGKVHALVRERHRSREFIEFLKLLDAAYPASTAIKLILDNHSAHISRETRAWLDTRPPGRFDFTFTPKHGSWLNLIEGFFSKFARAVLRHIRVTSKQELKERIMAGIDDVNRHPVIHTWSYKLAEAADMNSNHGNADLVAIAKDGQTDNSRLNAAVELLNRGYGRPAQSLDLHLSADAITKRLSDMTDAELAALEARMIAAAPIVLEATAEVSDDAVLHPPRLRPAGPTAGYED